MSKISSWIVSIAIIVFVGVIVDIILPNGKTSKLIKSVVAVLSILVIISPIKSVDIAEINFTNFEGLLQIDNNFLTKRYNEQIDWLEADIANSLNDNGFLNVSVQINGSFDKNNLQIKSVYVDLTNLVLLDKVENINKYSYIVSTIKSFIDLEEENVVFYE